MKISFLQWNIWYEEDIHNIAQYLKNHPADIICLQELIINHPGQTEEHTPSYIAEQLGYNYFAPEMKLDGRVKIADGVFSRYPILGTRQVWINEPTDGSKGFDNEYRVYAEVKLDLGETKVTVATSHMSYTHMFEETERKIKETNKLLEELKKPEGPFIFSGDLNVVPDSYTVKEVSKLLSNAGPLTNEMTWATKPFDYNGFKETELKWRLDYVFVSKDITVLSSKIEKTKFSDHLPIRAELVV
jgi:endonuclease/exonuclease/phosphatase family metal-dependent hydrolase